MKICFINILYSMKDQRGGLGAHIADLSCQLTKLGHQVTIITSGVGKPFNDQGVTIVPLGRVERYCRPLNLVNPFFLFRRFVYMVRVTFHVLRSDFDIVEMADGGIEQLFLCLYRNRPLVTKLHGNFRNIYSPSGWLTRFVETLEGYTVKRSDGIYASSQAYARIVAKEYGLQLARINIIPYGIDIERLDNLQTLDLKKRFPLIENKKLVFLSVGSSPKRKGAHVFLQAASKFINNNLLFVLSCTDPEFLIGAEKPENLLLLPNLERGEFYNWISQSDVIVFPSYFESFAIAVREAMLFNKAIILSPYVPVEGIDETYPKRITLDRIEPEGLATAISDHLNQETASARTTNDLQPFKDHYDIRRIARVTVEFYQEIADKFRSRSRA